MGGAAPAIVAVAEVVVAVVAPEVIPAIGTLITTGDTALAGAMLSDAAVASMATTEAVVAGGSAIGATTGALQAAATDKSVGQGALVGAGTGAVTAGVGQAIGDVPGAVSGAAKGAAGGFTGAELSGSNLSQATKSAEIGGVTGGITGGISDLASSAGVPSDVTRGALSVASPYIRQDVSSLFNPTPSTSSSSGTQASSLPSSLAGGVPGASSSALGQALNVGGGEINPPVQVGGDQTSRNVWNQASLRTTDSGSSS